MNLNSVVVIIMNNTENEKNDRCKSSFIVVNVYWKQKRIKGWRKAEFDRLFLLFEKYFCCFFLNMLIEIKFT